MSVLQVTLADEDARKLAEKAASQGVSVDEFVQDLIRQAVSPLSWSEVLRPMREAMTGHGMSDEDLLEFFEKERHAMRAEQPRAEQP